MVPFFKDSYSILLQKKQVCGLNFKYKKPQSPKTLGFWRTTQRRVVLVLVSGQSFEGGSTWKPTVAAAPVVPTAVAPGPLAQEWVWLCCQA